MPSVFASEVESEFLLITINRVKDKRMESGRSSVIRRGARFTCTESVRE